MELLRSTVLLECNTIETVEQPWWILTANEETRGLFCTWESWIAHHQSYLHCHLLVNEFIVCCTWGFEPLLNSEDSLKACFEKYSKAKL